MTPMKSDVRAIGPDAPPYVTAEVSANHNGDIDNTLKLIRIAAEAGVDAVKSQTYRPDTITSKFDLLYPWRVLRGPHGRSEPMTPLGDTLMLISPTDGRLERDRSCPLVAGRSSGHP